MFPLSPADPNLHAKLHSSPTKIMQSFYHHSAIFISGSLTGSISFFQLIQIRLLQLIPCQRTYDKIFQFHLIWSFVLLEPLIPDFSSTPNWFSSQLIPDFLVETRPFPTQLTDPKSFCYNSLLPPCTDPKIFLLRLMSFLVTWCQTTFCYNANHFPATDF